MSIVERNFTSFDGKNLKYCQWIKKKSIGTIIIFHGMAEHSRRYDNFAMFLNNKGYDVFALDFRGHGKSIELLPGYFADKEGWQIVVNDIKLFIDHVFDKSISKNIVLLGHSMGSLLLRSYLIKFYDQRIEKVVLSGTPAAPSVAMLKLAQIITEIIIFLGGGEKPSALLDGLVFGKYSSSIKNPLTPFDWLTYDKEIVKEYIVDPYCGFVCTGSFFRDLFKGISYCNETENILRIDSTKKILILTGDEDPVGDFGKASILLQERLNNVLRKGNVILKVYKGYRHETLNEIGKTQVYEDITEFIR
ncbi:alpha/beta fold hydrolase [Alkalibaculum sp. M08DMB]|uniref:Alpha/beta fold hydrolase n=1 Tax=Alkalibaculum sporogenes TaxID=2655001 RepID=A0A6A7K481_9FIRM|nr:alpha/beta fold hydrolase [Alkalibaculum sporogenes]MPW24188.1 alpha/beta fold hydrolase [Alkalibaculum sporogenes]